MKYLPIFNKGDKVTVNNKYIGLKSMVGEIYTIRAGPARCSDTWCYWLENVAGGIAADALEPLELTNEECLQTCNTEQLVEAIYSLVWLNNKLFQQIEMEGHDKETDLKIVREWLKQPHSAKE